MRLTTSLFRWGKVVRLCCVQIPRQRATDNLPKWFLAPTGSIKPWFHTEGKTAATLHHTFLLGSPNERVIHAIKHIFWRRCQGVETLRFKNLLASPSTRHISWRRCRLSKRISAKGVSRFRSLYFVIVLLSLFLFLSCLVCFIYQKHKKLVSSI